MLSKIILAGTGIAAAILLAPTAAADTADLTNAEVAGSQTTDSAFVPYKVNVPVANGGGGGSAYWLPVLDPTGKPYTDANGNLLKRCVSNGCGDDYGTVEAKTDCSSTGYAVNERPKPPTKDAPPADSGETE